MSGGADSHEDMITIEVNGVELCAPKGSMLIEATDAAGITVPRFCYHHKLSVASNCRMCLVEVEQARNTLPACSTPVASGMKVWTRSKKARAAQEDVMEFLLINHPLDCPICDQGGECELQDTAMGFGNGSSQYVEMKRVVRDKDIGPLIETEMTRCIHCTRCVRFGEEIAGLRELGATGRGENMEIGTYVSKAVTSELSGNVIDLCPVGALTAKPSRYRARAWEMQAHQAIAPHDSVGSNVSVHTFDGEVIRVVPDANDAVNECWISDRDRFSYQGLKSHDRLLKPQIKRDSEWFEVSWQQALDAAKDILQKANRAQLGGLASPCATLEELFLFQKLLRGNGFNHIDHRLRQVDFTDQEQASTAPVLGMKITELERQQAVLLIGSNCRQEQPLLNHRLKKAVAAGGDVIAMNPRSIEFNFPVKQKVVKPLDMSRALAEIVLALSELTDTALPGEVAGLCQDIEVTEAAQEIANCLSVAERSMVVLGNIAMQHPQLSAMRALSSLISAMTDSACGYFPEAANTVGASLAGVLPHQQQAGERAPQIGLNAREMLEAPLKTYVLLHAEVDDFANPYQAAAAFSAADDVIAVTAFADEQMRECATLLLPASTFGESAGTFVNAEGRWQSFKGSSKLPADTRPGWKILRVLGNVLDTPEFDYVSTQEVAAELRLDLQLVKPGNDYTLPENLSVPDIGQCMQRIGDVHMYRSDPLVRRATALQEMTPPAQVHLNPADMECLDIENGDLVKAEQADGSVQLPAQANTTVPEGCVWIQSATAAANALGDAFAYIDVSRV